MSSSGFQIELRYNLALEYSSYHHQGLYSVVFLQCHQWGNLQPISDCQCYNSNKREVSYDL